MNVSNGIEYCGRQMINCGQQCEVASTWQSGRSRWCHSGLFGEEHLGQVVHQGWFARNVATLRPEPKESNMIIEMFVKMNMNTLCF